MLVQALLFIAYAVLNTAAMVAIKEARGTLDARHHTAALGRLTLGGMLYAAALALLVLLLRRSDASSVFPIAIGCTVLATNAVGARFYSESITGRKIAGTLLVIAGIALTFLDGGHS